jgi:hypothetical protein
MKLVLGIITGAAITLAVEAVMSPRLPDVETLLPRRPQDAALYELCLMQTGNAVQCDAIIRVIERHR